MENLEVEWGIEKLQQSVDKYGRYASVALKIPKNLSKRINHLQSL
jgi:hypothetical protein